MSDVMLFGVLRMPYELAMSHELSRLQFWQRAQEACDRLAPAERLVEELSARLDELFARLEAAQWQPIETAPRGSGEDGPAMVTHPDYVAPPKLLLWSPEGMAVGYYDWYYHPGYGRGARDGEPAWRQAMTFEPIYGVTHWMPLPAPPVAAIDAAQGEEANG